MKRQRLFWGTVDSHQKVNFNITNEENRFRCTVTFLYLDDELPFESQWCSSKRTAEEDAARQALAWLDTHDTLRLEPSDTKSENFIGQLDDLAMKHWVSLTQSLRNHVKYDISQSLVTGLCQCTVTLVFSDGFEYRLIGDECSTKQKARHSAAESALYLLLNLND